MSELTLSDIDFYERKIKSVEQDNIYLHEEIMKLRARLRVAEDYQIKYSLMISNHQRETERMRVQIEKQQEQKHQQTWMNKIKANDEKWSAQLYQLQARLRGQSKIQIQDLKKQLSAKTQLLSTLKEKAEEIEFFGFKMIKIENENCALRQQLQEMRQFYQKQRTEEISKIRATLSNAYRQKIDKQKNKYEQQIADLENRLNKLQIQEDTTHFIASDATNRELISVKAVFQQKKAQYAQQLQALTSQLTTKNEQISKALQQNYALDQRYRNIIKEKKDYINSLEEKILEREKQHEIELLNLIQRKNIGKSSVNAELIAQNQRLNEQLTTFNELWNERILNHQNEIEQLNNRFAEQRRKIIEEKNMHKRKISELSSKMKEAEGERQSGDTQMLINSLRDMDFKEDQIGGYQNGITFLQRQYKKCQLKLEQKSRALSKLYKDINEIRSEADIQLNELKEKMKKDKKQNIDRILKLERQLRDTEDKLRSKEKQQRKRARQLQKDKLILEQQNKSLKDLNEELQRDYNRIIEGKKGIQASFRQEREKSFASKSDLNIIKKQKWLELEKQKNELQIIFKEKQQQLKLQFEQELDNKVSQINKLKQYFQITQQQNELLKKENERLHQQQEENKENSKMADYNKKMASLNLQIALTQNLYQSLIQAKSRINVPPSQQNGSDFKIDLIESQQQLHMSFHPSAKMKF